MYKQLQGGWLNADLGLQPLMLRHVCVVVTPDTRDIRLWTVNSMRIPYTHCAMCFVDTTRQSAFCIVKGQAYRLRKRMAIIVCRCHVSIELSMGHSLSKLFAQPQDSRPFSLSKEPEKLSNLLLLTIFLVYVCQG